MIDYFAIALTHGLIALAAWRLVRRGDLDVDPADSARRGATGAKPRDA
jgi:hypothetical protein